MAGSKHNFLPASRRTNGRDLWKRRCHTGDSGDPWHIMMPTKPSPATTHCLSSDPRIPFLDFLILEFGGFLSFESDTVLEKCKLYRLSTKILHMTGNTLAAVGGVGQEARCCWLSGRSQVRTVGLTRAGRTCFRGHGASLVYSCHRDK